jgi:YD repeat-containing protein
LSCKATSTNYTYDPYGNATIIATTVTDNDPKSPFTGESWESTTVNTISPDTSTWCLNLPTEATVTNTSPVQSAITRTVAYTPDYTNCRLTQKVTEPSNSTYMVTEGFGYDTTVGNLLTDTVTGVGMTARVTTLGWGTTGQFLTTIQNPLGQTITLSHDPNSGMLTSQTDPNWTSTNPIVTTWGYDDFARKTSEIRLDGTETTWSYNNCATAGCVNTNNVMTVTKTDLQTDKKTVIHTQNTYLDSVDRPLVASGTMLNGAFDRTEVQYDNVGNVHLQGAPCTFVSCTQYWTTNTCDVLNRLTESQRPESASNNTPQTTSIQYAGRTTTVTDAQSKVTAQVNHVVGYLGESIDANGYAVTFYYDGFGSLLSVFDNAQPTNEQLFGATYNYGLEPFQVYATYIDSGEWDYVYDALGELTSWSDPNAEPFSQTYDALSRPLVRTELDLTTTWGWGNTAASYNIGRLAGVSAVGSSGGYDDTYSYDSNTRLSNEIIDLGGEINYFYYYAYSPATGLPATLTYPTSTEVVPVFKTRV